MDQDNQFNALSSRLAALEGMSTNINHQHLGTDSLQISYSNLVGRKWWINQTLPGATAATVANYSTFWIAPVRCYVTGFKEVHATAGSDSGAATLMLEKLTGTTAPGSGVSILTNGTTTFTVSGSVLTLGSLQTFGSANTVATTVMVATTSALPTGLSVNTIYYIIPVSVTAGTLKLASSRANALAGTAITLSSAGTGTLTILPSTSIMLDTVFTTPGVANTVQTGIISPIIANFNLNIGDRLALRVSGTLTSVANVTIITEVTLI